MEGSSDEQNASDYATPDGLPPFRSLRSEDILQGHKEVVIEHAGHRYRLRVTSQGKLILTK